MLGKHNYNTLYFILFISHAFFSPVLRDGQTGRPARPGPGPVKPGQKPGRACCAIVLKFLSKPGPQRA
jgi:hypothetical protein